METKTRTTKVLPFDGKQGRVPGHEIVSYQYEWMRTPITYVVLERWDAVAEMMIEVLVHWTKWTKYEKKSWPKGGSIKAVILDGGRRMSAEARICGHSDRGYDQAPILCRDDFAVVTLGGGYKLLEIVGVHAWLYSKRTAEDTAKFLACPWERDNAESNARIAALTQQAPEPFFAASSITGS